MGRTSIHYLVQHYIRTIRLAVVMVLCCMTAKINFWCYLLRLSDSKGSYSLETLNFDGNLTFCDNHHLVSKDFGNRFFSLPLAILHPKSTSDIALLVTHVFQIGPSLELTIAARGHGHSLHGQAQAPKGIVVNMESLKLPDMKIFAGEVPYVDVSAGDLWIDVLQNCLKYGLAPRSWTDYLHLSVGGTLSNAGISGQAFRHGPQISNVHSLEIVTGKGEVVNCSEEDNSDLFHSALGGLGQFGIITRARIALEPAPKMVKWIRLLYMDFAVFVQDQELLITENQAFDYVEGFVLINRTDIFNNWRSSFKFSDQSQINQFILDGKTLYCLEVAKNFNPEDLNIVKQEIDGVLSKLSYIPSMLFVSEVSYLEFLDRVHASEMELKSKGLWDVPHPWLNLLIPRTRIHDFATEVFGKVLSDGSNGPILIYPLNKTKWDNRTSVVTPDENVFYLVAFLSSVMPYSSTSWSLEHILDKNKRILDYCQMAGIGIKQYLPHYTKKEEWRTHYGHMLEQFVRRKSMYDPLAILAPGQRIFHKGIPSL